jgi:hypothetical protein
MGARMIRSAAWKLAAVAGAALVWAHAQGALPARLGDSTPDSAGAAPATVTVVLVPSRAGVAAVQQAVAPDRIVATAPGGFALREGRVVAASHEAASELIGRAGWTDARIEILTPDARQDDARASAPRGSDAELAALAHKPTLSPADAKRVLELLE